MRKNLFLVCTLAIVFVGSSAFVLLTGTGIAGETGSPGESTCASCHAGGTGTTSVNFSGNPAFTGNMYLPGQTYTVSVTVSNASFSKFGFGCEILNSSNTNAGSMTSALTGVKFLNSGTRKNATHNTAKTGTGTATFSFVWVAPTSGTATIYACGNAVNGNGSDTGDKPSASTSLVLSPNLSAGISEVNKTGFAGVNVYPNPVISDLKLNYSLAESGQVSVTLTDLQGREIAILKNEKQEAGFYSFNSELPSSISKGLYFVKLSLEGKASAQRLIVVQ